MEQKYKARILEAFRNRPNLPKIVSLDIPDEYQRMDPELISLIKAGTEFHLNHQFDIKLPAPRGGPGNAA